MNEERMNQIRKKVLEMKLIGNTAIHKAIEENRKLGIANSFSRNGQLYYEMPNGSIRTSL